mmetsp:Transcript_24845/g.24505  ORF Transcript_24845/g.24505 Transcript_24845/m.24505 type:complete len:146 (+) Transcript_24845:709-1146(+)
MEFNFETCTGSGIENLIPSADPQAIDLIQKLLAYDWEKRISAHDALKHPYFHDVKYESHVKLFQMPLKAKSPEGDNAAGEKSKESTIYLPPIEGKKQQTLPKFGQGFTLSKKNITLDHKPQNIGKPYFSQWKSPYAAKHFYKSHF